MPKQSPVGLDNLHEARLFHLLSALPMCAVVVLSIDTYTLAICLSENLIPFRSLDKCSCVLLLNAPEGALFLVFHVV